MRHPVCRGRRGDPGVTTHAEHEPDGSWRSSQLVRNTRPRPTTSSRMITTQPSSRGVAWSEPSRRRMATRGNRAPVARPVDSEVMADPRGTRLSEQGHPAFPRPEKKPRHWVRRIVVFTIIAGIVGAALYWGIPEIQWMLATTSTDDAFVSGHTDQREPSDRRRRDRGHGRPERPGRARLGPRPPRSRAVRDRPGAVGGLAHRGQVEPGTIQAQVRAELAPARGSFFRRKNQQEQLRRQINRWRPRSPRSRPSSRARIWPCSTSDGSITWSSAAPRPRPNSTSGTTRSTSPTEQVKEAWAAIHETRAALGLEPNHDNPLEVPKDLVEQQSGVQTAVSDISSSLAQIGIPFDAHGRQAGRGVRAVHPHGFGQVGRQRPSNGSSSRRRPSRSPCADREPGRARRSTTPGSG